MAFAMQAWHEIIYKNNKTFARVRNTICERALADKNTPVLLMVSGGSDSAALTYICAILCKHGLLGSLSALHVNHCIRGMAADADEAFVTQLCKQLNIPLFVERINVPLIVESTGENVEAVARRERYRAAMDVLRTQCAKSCSPISDGRIFTAHTQDDRVENFYMRSIVGTGPGGFRSMRYLNGNVARPVLDTSRQDLRDLLREIDALGACVLNSSGELWCEDATNAHTDMFRAFVRYKIVPVARSRNNSLLNTLCRTMNLIADEDDYMEAISQDVVRECVEWVESGVKGDAHELGERSTISCKISPEFADVALPIQRRVILGVLQEMLGGDARIETASVDAILNAFEVAEPSCGDAEVSACGGADGGADAVENACGDTCANVDAAENACGSACSSAGAAENGANEKLAAKQRKKPKSGYSVNIQGNLAVSSNKRGVLIEPMIAYRKRRGRA